MFCEEGKMASERGRVDCKVCKGAGERDERGKGKGEKRGKGEEGKREREN